MKEGLDISLIDMTKEVLQLFDNPIGFYKLKDRIEKDYNITIEDFDLRDILSDMGKDNIVYRDDKTDRYILMSNSKDFIKGELDLLNSGNAYLINPDRNKSDIFIPREKTNKALNGDIVWVRITSPASKDKKPEGEVFKIVEREKSNIVGEIVNQKGKLVFQPNDHKYNHIKIPQAEVDKCVEGEIVCIKVSSDFSSLVGKIEAHLGHKDDAGIDVKKECAKHGVFDKFSDKAMEQAESLPTEVLPEDKVGRKDYTSMEIFTIDGADTKDIDDAISLEVKDGYYYLGVHIADVSNYVTLKSPLDEDAYERGTSTYPANYVIPMLPHILSNGICSLNEGVERLALSVIMKIDSNGRVISSDIDKSVIKSKKKMTYDNVNQVIEHNIIPEGYEPFADTLKSMHELAHIIRKSRINTGALDFDLDEAKIYCDEDGVPTKVIKRTRGEGEKLIEDFMIAANETVATSIKYMDLPSIYRCHDKPGEEKLQEFYQFCEVNGQHINAMKEITPREFQSLIKSLTFEDDEVRKIFFAKAVRTQAHADYRTDAKMGHFGLGCTGNISYTHFTSPIRRYPDLQIHRLVKDYLIDGNLDKKVVDYYSANLDEVCKQVSDRERESEQAERDVFKMLAAQYMENHVGEKFNVIVTDVSSLGMYVTMENCIEGLVPIISLTDDRYEYLEDKFCIIGKNTKTCYRLGDRLFVQCTKASKELKQIDFEIAKETEENIDGE